jgi:hypothetical protein
MFSIVSQAQRVQERLKSLVELNVELAKIEGKRKATAVAIAAGLVGLALVLVAYAIGFLFAAAAVGLHSEFALWLSLLIVAGAILLAAAIAVLVARSFAKKLQSPSVAADEAERTIDTVKTHA